MWRQRPRLWRGKFVDGLGQHRVAADCADLVDLRFRRMDGKRYCQRCRSHGRIAREQRRRSGSTFATQSGPVAGFQWSTIASPEYQNVACPATLMAKDAKGYTVTGFNGQASLSGLVGSATTAMLLGEPTPDRSGNNGTYTMGYLFIPSTIIPVTDVLHYSGSKVSIWTRAAEYPDLQFDGRCQPFPGLG